ncbi:Efflux ABC transporter, ATP-binding protein [hydrothermal vent metagenome]|uniref:Efflux ABC transporter, ATP-binding protein n=1 Tax=hydrothermal vent metagenome TaxID=652676 RepID=A0A3B1CKA7_9ZZZZ
MISINNLYKNYGKVEAVKGVSLEIKSGEMFGLIGPDGAGKTTIIRTMCGLINPTKGIVKLLGTDVQKHRKEVQRNIGYLSQLFSLYGDLTVEENIEFFANIHNITDYKEREEELLNFTNLIEFKNRLANNLSGGMKQKLALACSLIHKPKILFLDEPTTGVDPVSRRDFWRILADLKKDGITIVLTTPYLDEAERCTRVALMNRGKILDLDTPEKLKSRKIGEIVEIITTEIRRSYKLIKENFSFDVQLFGDRLNVVLDDKNIDLKRINELLNKNDIEILDKRIVSPTLENIFINVLQKVS